MIEDKICMGDRSCLGDRSFIVRILMLFEWVTDFYDLYVYSRVGGESTEMW